MIKPDELIKLCLLSPTAYETIRDYGLEHIRWLYKGDDLYAVNALDGLMHKYPNIDPIVALAKEPATAETLAPYEEGGLATLIVSLSCDLAHEDTRTEAKRELLDYIGQMATTGKAALEDMHAQFIIDALNDDASDNIDQLVAEREMDLRRAGGADRLEHLGEIMDEELAKAVEPRYATGIHTLDDALDGGFRVGTICTILASPGCGKTTLMGQILLTMCHINENCSALWFSLEQTRNQTIGGVYNFVAGQARNASEVKKLVRGLPIQFNDTVSDIDALADTVRIEKRRDPNLKVVVIDYVQLLEAAGANNDLFQLMFHASKVMKELSRREEVIIIVAAQLDKSSAMGDGKSKGNSAPTMFSVKGGGDLAQASSYMIGLHKPDKNTSAAGMQKQLDVKTDILILKNRFGKAGYSFPTWFSGKTRSFHACLEDESRCYDLLLTK